MTNTNTKLYRELFDAYKEAHSVPNFTVKKTHPEFDLEVSAIWKPLKAKAEFPGNVHQEILKWKKETEQKRQKLKSFWTSIPKPSTKPSPTATETEAAPANQAAQAPTVPVPTIVIGVDEDPAVPVPENPVVNKRSYPTRAQDAVKRDILSLSQDVVHLTEKRNTNCASLEQEKELKEKRKTLKEKQAKLKDLESSQKRQIKKRRHDKQVLEEHPEVAEKLNRRDEIGRPRAETDQPDLLKTIVDIATFGSSADDRRRSETLRTIKTLDELTKALWDKGYKISRSAVYLRLLPKKSNSTEGKRHVKTVPVRLKKANNNLHKPHADDLFCRTNIRNLETLASILGPNQVLFISQDDKAKVSLGIAAANKQSPMLMHVEYQIRLPDHDWVVAERHKLIPSVYGLMQIMPNMMGNPAAVTYSGPTYISVRSGKHCSSTAFSHGKDLDRLLEDEDFYNFTRMENGDVKPVLVITADGGPDENPRYEKVIDNAIETFQKYNLDAIYVATNAPGRSAFNRVERRMAPLSRELCGVILQHDHFGSHLEGKKTCDEELELKNFEHAGNTLCEIWNGVVMDGFSTKASYIAPEFSDREPNLNPVSEEWKKNHVRESHYFLQIVKCNDVACCKQFRGSLLRTLPRFIPAPLMMDQDTQEAKDNIDERNFMSLLLRLRADDTAFKNKLSGEVPYDISCPSVKELLNARVCKKCGIYFASNRSVKSHKPACKVALPLSCPALSNTAVADDSSLLTSRRHNRPVRVAAQRQREMMVIWCTRLNDQHVDWLPEEELENVQIENFQESKQNVEEVPIVTVADSMNTPWEDDE